MSGIREGAKRPAGKTAPQRGAAAERMPRSGSATQIQIDPESFALLGQPGAWREKADELKAAADALWHKYHRDVPNYLRRTARWRKNPDSIRPAAPASLVNVAVMLAGFALENLLKGLVVKHEPGCLKMGHLPKKLRSHDLEKLADLGGIRLTDGEREFCRFSAIAVGEWGRYPIPQNTLVTMVRVVTLEWISEFDALYARLAVLLPRLPGVRHGEVTEPPK